MKSLIGGKGPEFGSQKSEFGHLEASWLAAQKLCESFWQPGSLFSFVFIRNSTIVGWNLGFPSGFRVVKPSTLIKTYGFEHFQPPSRGGAQWLLGAHKGGDHTESRK